MLIDGPNIVKQYKGLFIKFWVNIRKSLRHQCGRVSEWSVRFSNHSFMKLLTLFPSLVYRSFISIFRAFVFFILRQSKIKMFLNVFWLCWHKCYFCKTKLEWKVILNLTKNDDTIYSIFFFFFNKLEKLDFIWVK